VYPGNVKPVRGLNALVEALPALEGVHAALITEMNSEVRALVERARALRCDDRLHVMPYVPPDDVSSFISDADVGINPLLRYGNADVALPNKILEYLHAGLPMVVSDAPTIAAFVRELGIGVVYPAGDHVAFASAVRRVLANPTQYRLDPAARDDLLDRFSWEHQVGWLIAAYDTLLAPTPSRAA
jgi:glycosyltransferase involved in cell wall biosynthesis